MSVQSPYNLYKNKGLPPTPIDSPGIGAIIDTVNPNDPELKADNYMVSRGSDMESRPSTVTGAQAAQGLKDSQGKPLAPGDRMHFGDLVAKLTDDERETKGWHPGYVNQGGAQLDRLQGEDLTSRQDYIKGLMAQEQRVQGAPGMSFDDSVDSRLEKMLPREANEDEAYNRTGEENIRDRVVPPEGESVDDYLTRIAGIKQAEGRSFHNAQASAGGLSDLTSGAHGGELTPTGGVAGAGRDLTATPPPTSFAEYVLLAQQRKAEAEALMAGKGRMVQLPMPGPDRFTGR